MLTVEDAVDPGDPMLWWALREAPALAGMGAPPAGFPFGALSRLGFDAIVSLAGPPSYDPAPLSAHHYVLHDLAGGHTPADPQAELAAVARAVEGIRSLRSAGRGVVVHCGAGIGRIGRTGLVIAAILVGEGEPVAQTCTWLDAVQRRRCGRGWPESPWQLDALHAIAAG